MGNDWYYYSLMAKQKEMDFMKEARLIRLRRSARPGEPMAIRLRIGLGNLLIRVGEAVKPPGSRIQPRVTPHCPADSCS